MSRSILYGILTFCMVVFVSCLGDPATSLTMANQVGVVATNVGPGKAVYVKGGDVISSEDFQQANVEEGECILFDYSVDYGAAENVDGGVNNGYITATIYENTISEVNQWNLFNTLDTVSVEDNELLISSLQSRSAYIKGRLFLFTEIKNHQVEQQDSFALAYNPLQAIDDDQIYTLYLRAFLKEEVETENGQSMIIPCAFDIHDFVDKIAKESSSQEVKFRINYTSAFGKDSLSVVWKSSDIFTIELSEK